MLIILEGPDNLGKSTLAQELANRMGAQIYKPVGSPIRDQLVAISQAEDSGAMGVVAKMAWRSDIIFDRAYPSEFAYGKAFNRADTDYDRIWEMDEAAYSVPHVGLMLVGDYETAIARAMGSGDLEVMKEEDWLAVKYQYSEFKMHSKITWREIDANKDRNWVVMDSMRAINNIRPNQQWTWMRIAIEVAGRSTCLSRHVGAVMVSEDGHVISTGYNGAPCGIEHQYICSRLVKGAASGTDLDLCVDVHAEENCVIQAANSGRNTKGSTIYTTSSPCSRCMRMLINAGVKKIVFIELYNDTAAIELARKGGIGMVQL